MCNRHYISILRAAYNNAEYCTKTSLLKGLPRHEANKAYEDLRRCNYLKLQDGCKIEETVSLNPRYIREVRQLLNPRTSGLFEFENQPSTSIELTDFQMVNLKINLLVVRICVGPPGTQCLLSTA